MASVRLTASAFRDIERICGYIAKDSVAAADRVSNAILEGLRNAGAAIPARTQRYPADCTAETGYEFCESCTGGEICRAC